MTSVRINILNSFVPCAKNNKTNKELHFSSRDCASLDSQNCNLPLSVSKYIFSSFIITAYPNPKKNISRFDIRYKMFWAGVLERDDYG